MDLCGSGVHCKCAFCVMQTDPLHTLDDLEDFQEDMRNAALMRATVGAVAMRKIVLVLVCLLSVICFAVVVWTGHGVVEARWSQSSGHGKRGIPEDGNTPLCP